MPVVPHKTLASCVKRILEPTCQNRWRQADRYSNTCSWHVHNGMQDPVRTGQVSALSLVPGFEVLSQVCCTLHEIILDDDLPRLLIMLQYYLNTPLCLAHFCSICRLEVIRVRRSNLRALAEALMGMKGEGEPVDVRRAECRKRLRYRETGGRVER